MPPDRRKVLVADDTPDFLFLLRATLGSRFELVEAVDGDQALAHWREHRDDLHALVLDQRMPGMTGLDVAREVRAADVTIPVLLFTAESSAELVDQAKAIGVEVISKESMTLLVDHPVLQAA